MCENLYMMVSVCLRICVWLMDRLSGYPVCCKVLILQEGFISHQSHRTDRPLKIIEPAHRSYSAIHTFQLRDQKLGMT